MKILPKYSGEYSRKFWKQINSLKGKEHTEAYALGVILQNNEQTLLKLINIQLKKESHERE